MADDLGASAAAGQLTLTACLVGLALGQLVAGPISDARGRRGPLLIGLGLFAVTSAGCAFAPSVEVLVVLRLAQGAAGAAGIVLSRAIVRDLYSGAEAARFFATLIAVNGLAPILAPVVGGQLLHVTDWRGIFVFLAILGALLWLAALVGIEETHREGRVAGWPRFGPLLRDPGFVGCALAAGFAMGAMFGYIAGSPFLLQDHFGVSEQTFSLLFALNAVGIVAAGRVSALLVGRVGPGPLLTAGVVQSLTGAVLLAVLHTTLAGTVIAFFVLVSAIGLVFPNATALAMERHPERAGSASALVGLGQFAIGAAAAPLVGSSVSALCVVIATLSALAVGARLLSAAA